jgi:hypothetical protein
VLVREAVALREVLTLDGERTCARTVREANAGVGRGRIQIGTVKLFARPTACVAYVPYGR